MLPESFKQFFSNTKLLSVYTCYNYKVVLFKSKLTLSFEDDQLVIATGRKVTISNLRFEKT